MAKCKCCQMKGFMIETDVSGLCSACAPYYYLTMPSDLEDLKQALRAIERINQPEAALGRIAAAEAILERIRPYADAGLAVLPQPWPELTRWLAKQKEYWQNEL